jgi:hypothetical protein
MTKDKCLKTEIEVLKERVEGMKNALILQASKYEERLGDLNHETERMRLRDDLYLSKEVYRVEHGAVCDKIEGLQKIIWMGIGGVLLMEVLLKFFIR